MNTMEIYDPRNGDTHYLGSILTGAEIKRQISRGNIEIDPYDESCINPNSYNVKLHPTLAIYNRNRKQKFLLPIQMKVQAEIDELTHHLNSIGNITYAEYTSEYLKIKAKYADEEKELKMKYNIDLFDQGYSFGNGLFPSVATGEYNEAKADIDNALDMKKQNQLITFDIPEEGYVLRPGVLYLGRTIERTKSDCFIPMIDGRSSIGRLGIWIHVSAGFGDIGFDGTWTLEITAIEPVRIYPNVEIGQVCFHKPYGEVENLYRGRYYKQEDPTESRFYLGKENKSDEN